MKSSFLLIALTSMACCFAQDFHGFSLDGPGFPSNSQRPAPLCTTPLRSPDVAVVRYAHPVPDAASRSTSGSWLPSAQAPLLLEFKNHTIDSALSYRFEGRSVVYTDLMNSTRTVPANRIDWNETAKLNRLRGIPDPVK